MIVLITCKNEEDPINQNTNGPVTAHMISGPNIRLKHKSSVILVICCKFYPLRRSAANNWQISTSGFYLVE